MLSFEVYPILVGACSYIIQLNLIRLSVVELVMRRLRVGLAGVVQYLCSPPVSQRGDSAARSLEISLPLHCVCVFRDISSDNNIHTLTAP